jgi:transposase-like protein
MRHKQEAKPGSAEKTVRDIRRAIRRRHSSEEKTRIVLEGLRGEDSIAELCRREGLDENVYYRGRKTFSTSLTKPGRCQRGNEGIDSQRQCDGMFVTS